MTLPLQVPDRLTRTALTRYGDQARVWLASLPGLAERYVRRWGLAVERQVVPGGALSVTLLVRLPDGTPATLKLGHVDPCTAGEAAALALWDGRGAVRLLDADPETGALLLERLSAEVSLRSLAEDRAMLEAAEVLRRLWVPPPAGHDFGTVTDRAAVWAGSIPRRNDELGGVCAHALVDEAVRLCGELAPGEGEPVLLHTDCHHGNVLAATRAKWLAIDPRPLVGEQAFDLGPLVRDRVATVVAEPRPQSVVRRRVMSLARSLDLDAERVRGWSLVQALGLGLWHLSAGDGQGEDLVSVAEWLA